MQWVKILIGLAFAATPLRGVQEVQAPVGNPDPTPCPAGRISYVFIDNHSIFDMNDPALAQRFRWAYRTANKLHIRTRKPVIARELLFRRGDCYDQARIDESARMLRAYDFISQADIYAVRQPDSTYHVIVDTQDEWTTQVDLRLGFNGGEVFQGGRFRESNLLGSGQSVSAFYLRRDVTRDYGFAYETPQVFGTRLDMRLSAGRTRAGTVAHELVAWPFLGEVGRWAFRQSLDHEDRLFDYIQGDARRTRTHVLAPVHDRGFDLTAVRRVGQRGNLTLFGTGVSVQRRSFGGPLDVVRGRDYANRVQADSSVHAEVAPQQDDIDAVRMALLLGQRNIRWTKRRGFDALRGQQDIRLGAEASVSVAAAVPSVSKDNDLFGTFSFYTGFQAGEVVVSTRGRMDARRDLDPAAGKTAWEDVYAEAELLTYLRTPLFPRHTVLFRAAGTGGWNTITPFQLTLGGDRGLRGFHPERLPGGRRAVFTLEDRYYFGWPFREIFDLGGSAFVDVGRMWPGDVPFGRDSGWRASGGLGLRFSFPAGSRNTYRADIAFPIDPATRLRDVRFILSVGEIIGLITSFGDQQVFRSRQPGVSGELFNFPN